ncbi:MULTISPECIES: DinB family protein [Flavobacteriaceae]|uniref:DinB family protein n=1 Tax=Flagellimonas marina TaxID=1775168 RepID=A0ABV8PMD2_9FLAO
MKSNRSEFMASRLQEVLLSGRWIAQTNIKEQIESISWQQANQKIGSLNTVALLTYHLNYYLAGILNVFNGGKLEIRDKYSFEMPPIQSETDWKKLKHQFVVNSEKFVAHVESMEDSQFDDYFVDEKYGTYQRNIEGVIEHSYYHLGQIVLINKMIQAE